MRLLEIQYDEQNWKMSEERNTKERKWYQVKIKTREDGVWWLEFDDANTVWSDLGEMLNCKYIITILSSIITCGFWFVSLES